MSVALTVVFSATGLYCLWRLMTVRRPPMETLVDVSHVVMGPAMVVMLWWPSAGQARWIQMAIFGGFAVVFLYHLAGSVTVTARAGALVHGAMNLGMVWMLAAMPILMSSGGGMAGMEMDMAGMDHGAVSLSDLVGIQAWTAMLSWVAVGLLIISAGWWLVRLIQTPGHRILGGCHCLTCAGMATMLALMTPAL
ncbi:DUF5134 domain-containing protein [Kribbella sp. NPDC055071]